MIKMYEPEILNDFQQNSGEWLNARMGILTASDVDNILTPARLEPSSQMMGLVYSKASEIICGVPNESYQSQAMIDGHFYQEKALQEWGRETHEVGLVKRKFNVDGVEFYIGASPDAMVVGESAIAEVKSSNPKIAFAVIVGGEMPKEHRLQVQTNLLVTGAKKAYYLHYSNGMNLFEKEIAAEPEVQEKIILAAKEFSLRLTEALTLYHDAVTKNGFKKLEYIKILGD